MDILTATKEAEVRSACRRKGVGVVLYHSIGSQVDTFYNSSSFNQCTGEKGNCGCAHAEPKAVMRVFESRLLHCYLGLHYSPCTNCANTIALARGRIDAVYFNVITAHDPRGIEILKNAGILVQQIGEGEA